MKKLLFSIFILLSIVVNVSAMEVESSYVKVITNDDIVFEIPREIISQSKTLSDELENSDKTDPEIVVRYFDSHNFSIIQKLLEAQHKNQLITKSLLEKILNCEIFSNLDTLKNIISGLQFLDCIKILANIIAILCQELNLVPENEKNIIINKLAENNQIHQIYIDKLKEKLESLKPKKENENNKRRKIFDDKEIATKLDNFKNKKRASKISKIRAKYNNTKNNLGAICPSLADLCLKTVLTNWDKDLDAVLSSCFEIMPGDETDFLERIKKIINEPINNQNGKTLLHLARSPNQVASLLALGANPFKRDLEGKISFISMLERGNLVAARTLFELIETKKYDLVSQADNKGNTAIHYMAMLNYTDLLKYIYSQFTFISLTLKNHSKETPLKLAIKHGNFDMVSYLMSKLKFEFIFRNDKDIAHLKLMIINNQTKMFNLLISKLGNRINEIAGNINLLSTAAQYGRIKIVKNLLANNANVNQNQRNSVNSQALINASQYNHLEIIQLLLNQTDIDVNSKLQGDTALILAACFGHREIVELLLNRFDLQINLHKQGNKALLIALDKQHKDIAKYLLLNKPDIEINRIDQSNQTALMLAAVFGYEDIAKLLVNRSDLQINLHDQGNKALILAIDRKHKDIAKYLLNKPDIDVNRMNPSNQTALTLAAFLGCEDIVKLLLNRSNLQINLHNQGNGALIYALGKQHPHIAKYLLNNSNIEINWMDSHKLTALLYAVENGYEEIVKLLLNRSNLQINLHNQGNAALIQAIGKEHKNIAKYLLNHSDIKISWKDKYNRTTLMFAVAKGNIEIVQMLLNRSDIDLNMQTNAGNSALMISAGRKSRTKNGQTEILQMLLNRPDIDLNLANKEGKTALIIATEIGHKEIIQMLQNKINEQNSSSNKQV